MLFYIHSIGEWETCHNRQSFKKVACPFKFIRNVFHVMSRAVARFLIAKHLPKLVISSLNYVLLTCILFVLIPLSLGIAEWWGISRWVSYYRSVIQGMLASLWFSVKLHRWQKLRNLALAPEELLSQHLTSCCCCCSHEPIVVNGLWKGGWSLLAPFFQVSSLH